MKRVMARTVVRSAVVMAVTLLGLGACKQAAPTPEPRQVAAPMAAPAGSAAADPWSQPKTARDPLARAFLWSLEKNGITSYALGTIHIGVDAEARLPDVVFARLDGAPAFAMETDLSDTSLMKSLECIGCSLRKDLGEAGWKKLETALGANAAAGLDRMKPMVAATMLSLQGVPMTTPMDGTLLARAQGKGKTIAYLEPASKQAALLEKWMNVKALTAMLADLDGAKRHSQAMLDAYIAGDDVKMVALSDEEKADSLAHGYTEAEYEASMTDMLYERNASWIAPIEKLHAAGGAFIAVGAMHLVGPRSVLELLAAKGFRVTRVAP